MKFKHFAIGLLAMAPIALAHHSFAMFELTKDVAYEGTVMEYRWENPHTHIIVKVDPARPTHRQWALGTLKADPPILWDARAGPAQHSKRATTSN
jgi:hypothetical protein